MRSKWPLRGFEPQFFIFEEKKKSVFNEKKAMEKARFEPAIFQSQVKRYTN
jgi:hypothetical protein